MSDPIANLLTSIRNAGGARLPHAIVPHSRLKESIARVLQREGYVADVTVEGQPFKAIKIKLKYTGRKAVIEGLRRISSPGLRRYLGAHDVPRVLAGMGVSILSTSEGIMTGAQARQKKVGGELLCEVW